MGFAGVWAGVLLWLDLWFAGVLLVLICGLAGFLLVF